jgi:hypothetical protein
VRLIEEEKYFKSDLLGKKRLTLSYLLLISKEARRGKRGERSRISCFTKIEVLPKMSKSEFSCLWPALIPVRATSFLQG